MQKILPFSYDKLESQIAFIDTGIDMLHPHLLTKQVDQIILDDASKANSWYNGCRATYFRWRRNSVSKRNIA